MPLIISLIVMMTSRAETQLAVGNCEANTGTRFKVTVTKHVGGAH